MEFKCSKIHALPKKRVKKVIMHWSTMYAVISKKKIKKNHLENSKTV